MLEILIITIVILGSISSWVFGTNEEKLFWQEQNKIELWMKKQDIFDKKDRISWFSMIRKLYRKF